MYLRVITIWIHYYQVIDFLLTVCSFFGIPLSGTIPLDVTMNWTFNTYLLSVPGFLPVSFSLRKIINLVLFQLYLALVPIPLECY